jgi:hypothetical protein
MNDVAEKWTIDSSATINGSFSGILPPSENVAAMLRVSERRHVATDDTSEVIDHLDVMSVFRTSGTTNPVPDAQLTLRQLMAEADAEVAGNHTPLPPKAKDGRRLLSLTSFL